ncbi:MAG: tetratricopeptide repeat protein, partial [Planctomycetota bacterium]
MQAGVVEKARDVDGEGVREDRLVVSRDASFFLSRLEESDRQATHVLWLDLRQQGGAPSTDAFEQALRVGEGAVILKAGGQLMRHALRHRRSLEAVHALDAMRRALPNGFESYLSAGELAEHLELAGDALLAARSAREAFSFYEQAERLPSSHAEREARLLRKRAMARDALGDHGEALKLQTQALRLQEEISWQERVQIFERLGEYTAKLGDNEAAVAWLERGLATPSAKQDSPEIASIWNNLGVVCSLRGDGAASRERHEQALRIRERIGDEEGVSRSLTNLSWADLELGELDLAEKRSARALEIKRRLGQLEPATSDLSLLAEIHKRRGEFAQAIARATETAQLRQSLGAAEAEVASQLSLAQLWLELGRYEEALRHSDLGLALLRRTGLKRNHLHASHFFRGRLELSLGRVQAAECSAQAILELTGGSRSEGYAFAARALLFALEEESTSGNGGIDEPVPHGSRGPSPRRHAELMSEGIALLGTSLDAIEVLLLLSETFRARGDFQGALAAARE